MSERQFGYADQTAFSAFTTEQLASDINYEIEIPLDYWKQHASIIPDDVNRRVNQLKHFLKLYQGDYSDYDSDGFPVTVNMHRLSANVMADTLAAFPPVFKMSGTGTPATPPEAPDALPAPPEPSEADDELEMSPRFMQTLQDALYCAIVDHIRFGCGLLMVQGGDYGAEVVAPQPIYWYPADRGADVLAVKKPKEIELYINEPPGVLVYERWSNVDDDTQSTSGAGSLGRLLGSEMETLGDEAGWDVVQEYSVGRATPLINIPRRPATGDWGRSLYLDITSLTMELNRRLGQNSSILTEHGWPREVLLPNTDEQLNRSYDALIDGADQGKDEREVDIDWVTQQIRLGRWRKSTIGVLSSRYRDIKYLQWTGRLNDHFNQIDEIKMQLYVQSHVPPALYGDGMTNFPAAGVALEKQYIRLHLYVMQLQATFINALRKAVLIGAMYEGKGAGELRALAEGLVIEWPNIFDEGDQRNELRLDENVEAEEMVTGEEMAAMSQNGTGP